MNDRAGDHARFDELAAGYALSALDPENERLFATHLPACPDCQQALAGYTLVTAGLAEGWIAGERAEPSPGLGERISAAVAQDAGPAPVTDLAAARQSAESAGPARPGRRTRAPRSGRESSPGRRRLVVLGASLAAAVALIAGGLIAIRLAGEHGRRPAAACAAASACHQIALTAPGTATTTARVIVRGRAVWVVPVGLRPDNRARQIYVLWQITTGRRAVAIGTFDVVASAGHRLRIGSLPVGYRQTRAFAVSLERGRTAPASPSSPVAAGLVSS